MEYREQFRAFILQPNEVLESGQLRITNMSKQEQRVTFEALQAADTIRLSAGPIVENGLEFRLRVL
jgi:hypothetical protein